METMIPLKKCTKCGEEKPATLEFWATHSKCRMGLRPDCKKCQTLRDKTYRETHSASVRITQKEYYARNKVRIDMRSKKYREDHKDEMRLYFKTLRDKPEHKRKMRDYNTKLRATVSETYVKKLLSTQIKVPIKELPLEIVGLKKKLIKGKRLIKRIKSNIQCPQ